MSKRERISRLIVRWRADERGSTAAEYGLLVAGIGLVIALMAGFLSDEASRMVGEVTAAITKAEPRE